MTSNRRLAVVFSYDSDRDVLLTYQVAKERLDLVLDEEFAHEVSLSAAALDDKFAHEIGVAVLLTIGRGYPEISTRVTVSKPAIDSTSIQRASDSVPYDEIMQMITSVMESRSKQLISEIEIKLEKWESSDERIKKILHETWPKLRKHLE